MTNYADKIEIFKLKKEAFKSYPYFIIDDLCDFDFKTKQALKPVMKEAIAQKKTVKFRSEALFIDGERYRGPVPELPQTTPARIAGKSSSA